MRRSKTDHLFLRVFLILLLHRSLCFLSDFEEDLFQRCVHDAVGTQLQSVQVAVKVLQLAINEEIDLLFMIGSY